MSTPLERLQAHADAVGKAQRELSKGWVSIYAAVSWSGDYGAHLIVTSYVGDVRDEKKAQVYVHNTPSKTLDEAVDQVIAAVPIPVRTEPCEAPVEQCEGRAP